MTPCHVAVVCCAVLSLPQLSWMYYSSYFSSRINTLMLEHHEDASRKIEDMNHVRFLYEDSLHYEMGYFMGEIIERYRKMVEHLKRPVMYKSMSVFETLKIIQLIQMLYFELYHLANMMHELPRKYGYTNDMSEPPTTVSTFDNNQQAHAAQDKLDRDKEERKRNRKHRLKELKKWRELILKGQSRTTISRRPQNKWWPIDYGWEIDYYW